MTRTKITTHGFVFFAVVLWIEMFPSIGVAIAATETQKLKIIYSSFTGAYVPLWIAVDEQLGKPW